MKQFHIFLGIVAVVSASGRRAFHRGSLVSRPDCIGMAFGNSKHCHSEEFEMTGQPPDWRIRRYCTQATPRYVKGFIDPDGVSYGFQCGVPEHLDWFEENNYMCFSKECKIPTGAKASAQIVDQIEKAPKGAVADAKMAGKIEKAARGDVAGAMLRKQTDAKQLKEKRVVKDKLKFWEHRTF